MSITAAQASEGASPFPDSAALVPATDKRRLGPSQADSCAPPLLLAVDTQRVRRRGSRRMVRHLHPPVAPRRARGRREARYHLSALGVLRDVGRASPSPPCRRCSPPPSRTSQPGGLTLSRFVDSNAGYPTCDPPRSAKVGAMPVSPAAADTGLVLSLHWLVVSFFALSFAVPVRRRGLRPRAALASQAPPPRAHRRLPPRKSPARTTRATRACTSRW
jgi:hypothetical protein